MIGPLDPATLSPPAQKILTAPPKLQELAARGVAPGIRPGELILLLGHFADSADPGLATTAQKTLSALPEPVLTGAIGTPLPALAIHHLAVRYHERIDVLDRLLAMPEVDIDTILEVAKVCGEKASELLATNEDRLLKNPRLIEVLYLNKNTRMSTADRMVELAVRNHVEVNLPAWKEAAIAIQSELVMESGDEPSPDDLLFRETLHVGEMLKQQGDDIEDAVEELDADGNVRQSVKEKYVPLYQRIMVMTNTQKIRLAQMGTPEELLILIGDASPLVSLAAAKSPNINDAVVEQVAKRKNISTEVLSSIGQRPDLLKRMSTKKDLIKNPHTPPSLAMRLIPHFQEHDLTRMVGDRNIAGSIRALIKNHLERKKR
jgi:hypothetical protein